LTDKYLPQNVKAAFLKTKKENKIKSKHPNWKIILFLFL